MILKDSRNSNTPYSQLMTVCLRQSRGTNPPKGIKQQLTLTTMTAKNYVAYIAANRYSAAFDTCRGTTEKSAIATIKRRNSPDWKDCHVWAKYEPQEK